MNVGAQAVDISDWYLLDSDPMGHKVETTSLPIGTTLEPGALYVFSRYKSLVFCLVDSNCFLRQKLNLIPLIVSVKN